MALPGHSPPSSYSGPGSPSRMINGHVDAQLPPVYGSQTRMLPPSPQNYRFPNPPPIPIPFPSAPMLHDNRNVAPYKRPGSSMSISSMLGGEPEKSAQEMYQNHNSRGPSRQGSISAPIPAPNAFSVMSPPHQASNAGRAEYSYKPRSQTPDRIGSSFAATGARQRSSSSGTTLQRPAPFPELHTRAASTIPAPRYPERPSNLNFEGWQTSRSEQEEKARRTSLSGILQRPNSQPQPGQNATGQDESTGRATFNTNFLDRQAILEPIPDQVQRSGTSTKYDIKPPGSQNSARPTVSQVSPVRAPSLPISPEVHRPSAHEGQGRTLASILNGPLNQPPEFVHKAAQRMSRQDSAQSQGDRSIFADRGKHRPYSPFATSLTSQGPTTSSIFIDEQGRKGSDELSQHRALLGLAAESKRGRYSPMPQVMQGAQAQTPVPDAGVKTEHGRVFSGLGGGIVTTPTPMGGTAKRDDGRTPLNEDNLVKISRSTSGPNKRSRKVQDEDVPADSDGVNGSKIHGRTNKKSKYQHSYKVELDDAAPQTASRRNTPLVGPNLSRNGSAASKSMTNGGNQVQSQHQRVSDGTPAFKPRKTIKVASMFNLASKAPRRHLGNFVYRPEITQSDTKKSNSHKFNVSIRPNLLPSFSTEHINCTYTVHVSRLWLQDRERGLICSQQYLWGSGIYTDDSDPIAAAVHAGFLQAGLGEGVDTGLLSRVIQEQNPKIEWPNDVHLPSQPMEIDPGKDLNITLLVLPLLERYEGTTRFGIKSRTWPEGAERTQHDGMSLAVLKVEFLDIGTEEMRIGRTGKSRRERLRMDIEGRHRGLQIQKEKIAKTKQKRLTRARSKIATKLATSTQATSQAPKSVPITIVNGTGAPLAQQFVTASA